MSLFLSEPLPVKLPPLYVVRFTGTVVLLLPCHSHFNQAEFRRSLNTAVEDTCVMQLIIFPYKDVSLWDTSSHGGSSESHPVLKACQSSAGLCLTALLSPAKPQILICTNKVI